MNRFRDLSGNNRTRQHSNFRRNDTNRFKSNSRFSSNNNLNLPTNSRWKRDDESSKQKKSFNTQNNYKQRPYRSSRPQMETSKSSDNFINSMPMEIGFGYVKTKPKQNKQKKKKKKQQINDEPKNSIKKYSKKYELTNEEDDTLNASIINQYNYEIIEESEPEENGEENVEETE